MWNIRANPRETRQNPRANTGCPVPVSHHHPLALGKISHELLRWSDELPIHTRCPNNISRVELLIRGGGEGKCLYLWWLNRCYCCDTDMVITLSPGAWCWYPGVHWTPSAPPLQTSQVPWHRGRASHVTRRAKWENITNTADLRNWGH